MRRPLLIEIECKSQSATEVTLNPYQALGRMATHAQQYKCARPGAEHKGRTVVLGEIQWRVPVI